MNLELYTEVALKIDIPEDNLKKGDITTLIDFIPHPQDGELGCVLEVFNAIGQSIAVVTVPKSAIKALAENEILTTRLLEKL
ncbi:conserved hypothetical protein [Hyella patelloides LEGE 07179]|uniref:DUF4926 domain-containing protein n=1 Tax=Hyella patelloides LEGE 07179 TaxID=945734 RepID=A0A563VK20_9CYAN|nr:DUF4926 domain-containing protein [Hyella patelloides]VEP11820.1 conserved hypothetical protein [Hyella patelloides LEGE 07179]